MSSSSDEADTPVNLSKCRKKMPRKKIKKFDSTFYFKDETHGSCLRNRLFSMFKTGEFSDVTICVGGKRFKCHKNILAANSHYFQAMFSCGLKEKTEKEVKIENVDSQVFEDIMRYLYYGEVNITSNNAQSLLECSDMMQLEELKFGCSQYFENYLSAGNCFGIWHLGAQVNASRLNIAAWKFALANFPEVAKEEEFPNLTVSNLSQYLSDPELNAASEEIVCDIALKWLKDKAGSRTEKDVEEIFSAIRFCNLDVVYIKTKLLQNSIVKNNSQIVHMLNGLLDHLLYNFPLPYDIPVLMPRLHTAMRSGIMIFGAHDKQNGSPFSEDLTFVKHENKNKLCVNDTGSSIPACYYEGVPACVVDGVVYLSGLGSSAISHDECYKYEVSTDEWLACAAMDIGRSWHSMIRGYKDKIYILGGLSDEHERFNCVPPILDRVEEYIIERNVWELIGHLSLPVYASGSVFHRGFIYMFGGAIKPGFLSRTNCIQSFDTTTNQCSLLDWQLPGIPPKIQSISFKNWAILLNTEKSCVVDLEKLDKTRQTFPKEDVLEEESFIRVLPGVGYSNFGAALLGNQIFVLGGGTVRHPSCRSMSNYKGINVADLEDFLDCDVSSSDCSSSSTSRSSSSDTASKKTVNWKNAGRFDRNLGIYTTAVVKLYTERPQPILPSSNVSTTATVGSP